MEDDGSSGEGGGSGIGGGGIIDGFAIDESTEAAAGSEVTISGALTLSSQAEASESLIQREVSKIVWSSSDAKVAEATGCVGQSASEGRSSRLTVTIAAKKEGTAVITGTASNGKKAGCTVTVKGGGGIGGSGTVTTSSDNDIAVYAYDIGDGTAFPQPIKDAAVTVDNFGNASTDSSGKAVIENGLTDQPLMRTKISVTKEGYREYYFYKDIYHKDADLLYESNRELIYMRKLKEEDKANPYISALMCQTSYGKVYDAMVQGETYQSNEGGQGIKIQMNAVWNGKTPASYMLYQENGNSYTSTDGMFQLDMGEDFKANEPIYAKVVAEDGTAVTDKTRFEIKRGAYTVKPEDGLEFINTDSTGTLGEDAAFLSGESVKVKLGGIGLDVSVQEGKVKAIIGKNKKLSEGEDFFSEGWEEWKKLCEHQPSDLNLSQWKDVIESVDTQWTPHVKGETEVYGYLEGAYNQTGKTVLSGNVKLKTSLSEGIQAQYTVGVIPVYAKISIAAGGEAKGTLSYNWTEKKIDSENSGVTFSVEPSLAAEGGVGVMAVATAGVEGKGSMPFSAKLGSNDEAKLSLKGGLSIKAKLLKFEYSLNLAEKEWKLLPLEESPSAIRAAGRRGLSMDDFQLSDSSYLDEESVWLGDGGMQPFSLEATETGSVERVLKTNISPDADMQMVAAGNTKMLLWTEDDPRRETVNSPKLVYSVYHEVDDTWSAPEAVAEDGTADFAPSAVSDGERIYVAWQNIGREFENDAKLSELAAASTIAMSVYTPGEGFSDSVAVSEAGCMAAAPKVALNAKGKPYVAYLQNTDGNLLLTTGQNNIRYSVIDGGSIEHGSFVEDAGLVTALDTAYANGYEVSYTLDKDNDLSTLEDREIITKGASDATTQNECLDSNAQYVANGGRILRFWYQDGSIVLSGMDGEDTVVYQDGTRTLTDNFYVVSGQENQLAVVWTAVDADGNKQIEGSLYDPDRHTWSKSIQISDTDASVYNPQGIFTEDGSLQFLYKKTGEAQTDLCVLMADPMVNLAVENAYCDEEAFSPGSMAKVIVQIKNNGTKRADGITVDVNGTKTLLSESIVPGESIIAEADYAVPAELGYQEISIEADADGEIDVSDNHFSLPVGHADLSVSVTDSRLAFGQLVEIGTANHSCVDTAAALEVRKGSREGELVTRIDLGTIRRGELVTATYLWNEDAENYDADAEALFFNVISEKPEKYVDNNYDFIATGNANDAPVCVEHDWSEGEVTKAPSCTESGEKEFICTVCGESKTEELKATGHQATEVRNQQEATCVTDGYSGDVYCKGCNAKIETGQSIAAAGHAYKSIVTKATAAKNGSITEKCAVCGDVKGSRTIAAVKSASVTADSYTYDGKAKEPSVMVTDSNGQAIGSENYTVAYQNNVNVGKAAVTISMKGNYDGALTEHFTICPKGTSLFGKPKASSKGIAIRWKKQPKSTTGYQVQVSASKKFTKKGTVTKTVKKKSVTKLTVRGLKPGKTYYVRVRTYKTVKGKRYCSGWSKMKFVKSRK